MMLILDTHTFLWWDSQPANLSPRALALCQAGTNELILSVVSLWEIRIKLDLGKLTLPAPMQTIIDRQRNINGLRILPVELSHVLALEGLPSYHKDPFDRLLVAQAKHEGATLVSRDAVLAHYPVPVIW